MDYKKSYTLLWGGLIAGFVLMLIGVFLEIGWLLWPGAVVVMADVLQTLLFFRCPYCGGHWDPLPGVWGVHSVKILSYWQNKAALRLQSGLAVVSNKRQLVRQDQGAASAAP